MEPERRAARCTVFFHPNVEFKDTIFGTAAVASYGMNKNTCDPIDPISLFPKFVVNKRFEMRRHGVFLVVLMLSLHVNQGK